MKKYITKFFLSFWVWAAFAIYPASICAQTNADYAALPPFIATSIQPNVLLVLDNSGSMNDKAYATTYDPAQFTSGQYYGYFDPANNYQYSGNNRWEITALPFSSGTIASPIASGNFLNWAAMRRIDVAKKLLIGGKADPRSPLGAVTVKLNGENASTAWNFYKSYNNTSVSNLIAPFTGNYRYRMTGNKLYIDPIAAGSTTVYSYPNADISVDYYSTATGTGIGWWGMVSGVASHNPAFDKVDETTSDGNTTYIKPVRTANPAIFDYNYTGGNIGSITNVAVKIVARKYNSTSSVRRMQGVLYMKTGSSSYTNYASSYSNISNSYATYTFSWTINPATLAAWKWDDITSNDTGSLKGFGVKSYQSYDFAMPTITQIYLSITSSTPSGGPYNIIVDQGQTKAEGIIDHLGSDARFGLAYYADSSNGGRVQEYVGFGAATNMITSISNLSPSTWTPLAETLYEMTRYFRQDTPYYSNSPADYQVGANYDPYYYKYSQVAGSGLTDQYMPCAKSFVLMLTDGESTQDTTMSASIKGYSWGQGVNPDGTSTGSAAGDARLGGTLNGQTFSGDGTDYLVDAAYWARKTDHRTLDGNQNINVYSVFMFGKGSTLLKDAAIYGGFDDLNGDNKPGPDIREYLRDSNGDGNVTADDDPITYFEGDDGYELEQSITNAIASILKRSASGTAVSVLSTSAEGDGALYQSYFYPERILDDGSKKSWLGYCRGLFLDSYGNMREDSNTDAKLVFKDDKILRMRLDASTNEVKVDLYSDTSPEDGDADPLGSTTDTIVSTVGIDDITPIWEGGKKLALKTKSDRNIYVWLDSNNDGAVNGDFGAATLPDSEAYSFVSGSASVLQPYFNASTAGEAGNIINFIRGNVVTGYRNRCVPITGAATETGCAGANERVWTLGDILYSTQTVVAKPMEQYDSIYGQSASAYTNFRSLYKDRRQIVYVGANDGMLHAFNGGVYTAGDIAGGDVEHGLFAANPTTGDGWGAMLGDELWAFVPYDNMPHLKWLTSASYAHVYYTDLKPKATDVRIFCDSDTTLSPPTTPNCVSGQTGVSHPGGWGTILIVGMRLGGGAIDVTAAFDGTTSTTRQFRSAYYVFDVTNPEKKPRLLWRFTNANLGFTTSYPSIIHINSSPEKWFMVVGSGPDNNVPTGTRGYDGTSEQQGRIFIVNLLDGTTAFTFTNLGTNNGGTVLDANTFMGDPTIVDGDLDYTTDVLYIGSAISTTSGKVFRINTNQDADPANWVLSTLINQGKPVLVGPSVAKDSANNLWVLFGTGRYLSANDKTNSDQQTFYGIKDACWQNNNAANPCSSSANPYLQSALFNSSAIAVCTEAAGGGIYNSTTGTCGTGTKVYNSYTDLLTAIRATSGWYVNLTDPAATSSERNISRSIVLGGIVLFTTFTPSSDTCAMLGDGDLYALYYETGTAYIVSVVGITGSGTTETVARSKDLGKGMPSAVGAAIGEETKSFIQTSTGSIAEVDTTPAFAIKSGPASWREKSDGGGTVDIEEIYKHIIK